MRWFTILLPLAGLLAGGFGPDWHLLRTELTDLIIEAGASPDPDGGTSALPPLADPPAAAPTLRQSPDTGPTV